MHVSIADPHITEWLNHHPLKNDPEAPLWVIRNKNVFTKMNYNALRMMLERVVKKTGIQKRVYPHLFRHSRVTHLLRNKQINEAQAKVFFGWSPESGMLSEYDHLVSGDVNDTILQMHGIFVKKDEIKQSIKSCPRCGKINADDAINCMNCSSLLDVKVAIKHDEEQKQVDEVLNELMKDSRVQEILKQKILELEKKNTLETEL